MQREASEGVRVEAQLPLKHTSVERVLEDVVALLRSCEIVGDARRLPDGRVWVRFLPRHLGVRIPHSYVFTVSKKGSSLLLEGRAPLRRLIVAITVRQSGNGTLVFATAQCRGNPLLRRIARPEVHRFLAQLVDSLYLAARRMEGSERSPTLITQ